MHTYDTDTHEGNFYGQCPTPDTYTPPRTSEIGLSWRGCFVCVHLPYSGFLGMRLVDHFTSAIDRQNRLADHLGYLSD